VLAPHIKYANGDHNGYLLVEFDRNQVAASWWFTGDVKQRDG